jgi:hypothetical protein
MNVPQNKEVLSIARNEVKRLLTSSEGFRQLDPDVRKSLAHDMVKIASYIAAGERGDSTPNVAAFSSALAAPKRNQQQQQNANTGKNQPPQPKYTDPGAQSASEYADTFVDTVKKVDFPKFVADLVNGVFNAIVDSSIKQMNAYADLVKNVAKSVDQYMKDNVTQNQARDYLVDKYPNHLELNLQGEDGPKVQPKEGADEATMPNFFADLGLPNPGGTGVDADTVENQLVPAARKRLAMDRQQLLATMVLMGVNRLIVTDGSLKASVVFDFKASAKKTSKRTAVRQEHTESSTESSGPLWGWLSGYSSRDNDTEFTVESLDTSTQTSEQTGEVKAKLAGEVNLRFKSETFPLDKMTDLIQPDFREKIQANQPAAAPKQPAAPAAPPPPPPQLPPLPAPPR